MTGRTREVRVPGATGPRPPPDEGAFTARLGAGQGRAPDGEGGHAFVLGQEEPGWRGDLEAGDYAEVRQEVDLSGATLVRVRLRLRVPKDVPPGLAWQASLWVGGVRRASARAEPGRTRLLTDLAASVGALRGAHAVAVRLELVAG
ncbi:MAG TPA: hypothetical protein VFS43_14965 [Polyangiaceae bacterium]|nr:hypothetical protein [Polyangiaceae bacterium]